MNRTNNAGAGHRNRVSAALPVAMLLVVAACGGADSPGDTATETATETPSDGQTDGSGGSEDEASAEGGADDAEAIALGEMFMAAHKERDAAAIQAIADPDASVLEFGFWRRTPAEYDGLFQWMDILDWAWINDECTIGPTGPPKRVICTYETENDWSRSRGLEPVPGSVELAVTDGIISEVVLEIEPAWADVFTHWILWLDVNYPDDLMVLFRFDDDGDLTGGPATDPEAIALYNIRVPEYVAAQIEARSESQEDSG